MDSDILKHIKTKQKRSVEDLLTLSRVTKNWVAGMAATTSKIETEMVTTAKQ